MGAKAKSSFYLPDSQRKKTHIPILPEDLILFAKSADEVANAHDCYGATQVFPCPIPNCNKMAVVTRRTNGAVHATCPGCKCEYDQQLNPELAPREWEEG